MKKDLPENKVANISIAVVLEGDSATENFWNVYLINEKDEKLDTVMITSKGYGELEGKPVMTSTLRHVIGDVEPQSFVKVEAIDSQVFGLTNEYWLSFYINQTIYDKKYIFLPESIVDENLIKIPLVNKPGILIGGLK
ncbi:hypothetical protein J5U18_08650 [Sphingobacteriaceae bacterium WQ 2009]|uniref:Uncharacterized protein n=1 Tax=Rhinopithecimicrobium faecis TaxID=2820698 RepID=A0A8T4HE50_9SPHI|nr:hypothetical protein [Sphingobacteriaceae bacterium WQ 2009]